MSSTFVVAGVHVRVSETFRGMFGRTVKRAQFMATRPDTGALVAEHCKTERDAVRMAAMAITNLPACELHRVAITEVGG